MLKRIIFALVLLTGIFPHGVIGQETARVMVLPFSINAEEQYNYLEQEIPKVVKENLKSEGAVIIEPEKPLEIDQIDEKTMLDQFRSVASRNGADYAIWGSFTLIGQQFSLDVKMIDSLGVGAVTLFFEEGTGIENLSGAVRALADKISLKLFKRIRITEIVVTGNDRIETDAIEKRIKTKPGDDYKPKALSDDLKSLFAMGFFDDIRIEAEEVPDGKRVTFIVQEKPTVRVVRLTGNVIYEDEEIEESLTIRTGSILNVFVVQSNVKRIEELYKEKNYHNVKVDYKVIERKNNQADIEFTIEEGRKLRVKKITFEGNSAFEEKKLKKITRTREDGLFSFFTNAGDLKKENLAQDIAILTAFYQNQGYIQAKVGEPIVEFKEDGIYITFKISEGSQFKLGNVDITGDLILPKEELMRKVKITNEEFFSREKARRDVLRLTDLYSDAGYAFATIVPKADEDPKNLIVHISYQIDKGPEVYFEKIIISGNTKTRDKVIRRQLKVYEQELYSGARLKRGVRNLYHLDFFEDIKVDTTKGSADDKMILKIDVTEKETGSFSVGGGFSSVENMFGMVQIDQKNLFGRGQKLDLKAELGGRSTKYSLTFTEPWMFDIPLSLMTDVYKWDFDYDDYDKNSIGFGIGIGYPVFKYTRASLNLEFESLDVINVDSSASDDIKELQGVDISTKLIGTLRYNSTDKPVGPTRGQKHTWTNTYAGFSGDIAFMKSVLELGLFIPLFWDTVGVLHSKGGYVRDSPDGLLPDYERFYLGGIGSVRGFDFRDISVRDDEGNDIGGTKFVQFNVEYIFPLFQKVGISGVTFFDAGNVYAEGDSIDLGYLRESAGLGVRWLSPFGPLRIEYGWILDRKDGEDPGKWEFGMGAGF